MTATVVCFFQKLGSSLPRLSWLTCLFSKQLGPEQVSLSCVGQLGSGGVTSGIHSRVHTHGHAVSALSG